MLHRKSYAWLAMFACGVAMVGNCQAQVKCLQYPIYDDGMGMYLFVTDLYSTNDPTSTPPCGDYQGEDYYWTTAPYGTVPQTCGNCIVSMSAAPRVAANTTVAPIPSAKFQLGTKNDGKPIGAVPATPFISPAKGISVATSTIVWVKTKTGSIPVKIFRTNLDYAAAGVPKEKWPTQGQHRSIFVGFEVKPDGLAKPTKVYTPTQQGTSLNSGKIDVTATGETHTYHVVSWSPLF